jgi:hypothetical protein
MGREGLARRAAGQYSYGPRRPETSELIPGHVPYILLEELGLNVVLEWIPAPRVNVKASNYVDSRTDEAMGQPSCAAEQVNCANEHISNCHTSNLAEIRPDVDQHVTGFLAVPTRLSPGIARLPGVNRSPATSTSPGSPTAGRPCCPRATTSLMASTRWLYQVSAWLPGQYVVQWSVTGAPNGFSRRSEPCASAGLPEP